MDITIHRSFTADNIQEVFTFSYLMIEAGELKEAVFTTVTSFLQAGNGCYFSISDNGKKIAYGLFSYGQDDKKLRRLYYFAVESEYRGTGLGKKALKLALDTEVNRDHGCTVACNPRLRKFYESVGFEYYGIAEDKKNEIVLAYYNPEAISIKECVDKIVFYVEVQAVAFEIFNDLKNVIIQK
ncbi:MAG: GNAT superfamily N-acetyltransferase [Cocleimonas sp.]|jgi:GNAT superfamily N-acetyltransferase